MADLTAAARRWLLLTLVVVGTVGAASADLNEAGKTAYLRGDYVTAERLFREAIAQAPREPVFYYHRALALTGLERWREAAGAYQAALRLDPSPSLAAEIHQALSAVAPLARPTPPRPRQSEEAQIPLRREGGGWVTDAVLDDRYTARFLVDTGASVSVISPELARLLAVEPEPGTPPIQFKTLAGRTEGPLVTLASVRVGDVEARNVRAVIHPLGPEMDGILGNTFLARYVVRLDPERAVLGLRPR